jgi:hypothetical protein
MRTELARTALKRALDCRQSNKIELKDSFCVFDVAEASGIEEIRFLQLPTLEELYWKDEKKLLLGSLRPAGRQAFSCAHGFGHHVFGHGMCISAVNEGTKCRTGEFQPNEFLAEMFAGFFLMPKTTVCNGFHRRGWDASRPQPLQTYVVAGWLGVGYTTLVQHMCGTLKLIDRRYADRLMAIKPAAVREHVFGRKKPGRMWIVDKHWTGRPVDVEVGDTIVLAGDLELTGVNLVPDGACRLGECVRSIAPGSSARIVAGNSDLVLPVRVSRRDYQGRNIFRFDEDPDHEAISAYQN